MAHIQTLEDWSLLVGGASQLYRLQQLLLAALQRHFEEVENRDTGDDGSVGEVFTALTLGTDP